jgi:hypothetical protein
MALRQAREATAAQLPCLACIGGEGGIRTLEGLLTLTPLAGARLRPLGHLSGSSHKRPFAERGMIPAWSSLGKVRESIRLFQASSIILAGAEPTLPS